MFFPSPLLLVLYFGFFISANPFRPREDSVLVPRLSATPLIVKPTLPSNTSIPALNGSAENRFNVHCDGATYGYNPNIIDCEQAVDYLIPDTTIWTFGQRHTGLPEETVPLPYRVMGDRGLCYFQAILVADATTARASIGMLRRAAQALVLQCAAGGESQGGIVTNIGGDNRLAVILGKYHLPATCHSTMPSWESCRVILYDMSADKVPRIFGPSSDPTVTENLPHKILSPDLVCSVNVFTNGQPDVLSYYEIWEAVVAVFSVCTRYGKPGSLRGLGEHGDVFVSTSTKQRLEIPSNFSGDSISEIVAPDS